MKVLLRKFELDMQALFDPNFHLNLVINLRFVSLIKNNKFFLPCYAIIVPVNHDVDKVPKLHHNSIISLILLFNSIELEIV